MLNLSKSKIDRIVEQEKLYSLRAIKTPRAGLIIARFFMVVLLIFIVMLFLPWQQNIRGTGKVTPFNPGNRPQTVETAIAGRIQKWHVQEGQYVEKGDTIITLSEIREKYFDPLLLLRLSQQIEAKQQGLFAKHEKASALARQIEALRQAMDNKINQAKAKLDAEQIRFENLKNQYERNKTLYEAGNIPLTKFQEIEYRYRGAQADYVNAQIELNRVQAEYLDKISKAESDRNQTRAEIFETEAELAKLRNEYANMQIRNQQYQIIAPQDGIVVKAMKAGIGETIKEGDAVCMIMPAAETPTDIAAEMYIRAMDVPLVSKGRKVRIIFDGWPALQFSGWPSVSVGTFGGVVRVIDMVNTGPGEFRLLIVPDSTDTPWPKQLRVGSGIKGWVMLDDVPIWYEIWRQLNGFPPSLYQEPLEDVIEKKSPAGKTSDDAY
ncbi:MAG: biotin attachment protein [Cyclobacteriaceae bacterium]|nr:MAG: biotin attachment protein [Cyclobacteriaceae bacterium]